MLVVNAVNTIIAHLPDPSEWTDSKVVYRRYASLFFVTGISAGDNELITLEIIHRYVEVLDRYFGNVSRDALAREILLTTVLGVRT